MTEPPRRGLGVEAVAIVAVVALVLGVLWLSSRDGGLRGLVGGEPVTVSGEILYASPELATQLGPGGWFQHPDDEGRDVIHQARTGDSWTVEDLAADGEITPDGRAVQVADGEVLVHDARGTDRATGADIVEAHGDDELWPGTDGLLVGVSEEHVAVLTCLAPTPTSLREDGGPGSGLVLAGVRLDDADVSWTRALDVPCGPEDGLDLPYPSTLPAQRYTLVETGERTSAIDLDTGEVAHRWSLPRRDLAAWGERVLAPTTAEGGEVRLVDLADGRSVATATCPGARVGDPGDVSGQLATSSTPFVTCDDTVLVWDGEDFVDVQAPPVDREGVLRDGEQVAQGRVLLRRVGESVEISDALTGDEAGTVPVPSDHILARYGPVGRLLLFVRHDPDGPGGESPYVVVDSRSAEVVATTDGGSLRSGAATTPEGEIMLRALDDEDGDQTWVAGVRDPEETP